MRGIFRYNIQMGDPIDDAFLSRLPEHRKETFLLAYREKLTYAEIAAQQNITEATVKVRLHRVRYQWGKYSTGD
jgi:RNA polymerase sigma factor (sigma-70 family)